MIQSSVKGEHKSNHGQKDQKFKGREKYGKISFRIKISEF
jgi:hypothetical protein